MKKIDMKVINRLLEYTDENNLEPLKIGENVEIGVKKTLSIDEFYSVCAALSTPPIVKSDDGVGTYITSGEVTGFKVALIRAYIPELELPDNVVEAYQICSMLNLFQKLHGILKDTDMYLDLWLIAERYSEYHRLMNSGLGAIESTIANTNLDEMMKKIIHGFFDKAQGSTPPNVENS